ncbi:acetyl-CoA C-acetyltransferase [Tundrisphaera lichenicola]|uniref:acetyl-CoA C-acetyltransferase n=1 Tax=Tundrisphaera lichenicola TaxID=2029860 RepID=UPI003EBCD3AF
MDMPVILAASRTPIGKFRGSLAALTATELGSSAISAVIDRAGIDPSEVEEVIMGHVLTAGVGQAPARQAALGAGLPPTVAALTINKVCGSGLKAVMIAAQAIRSGDASLIVAGGQESMSRAPFLARRDGPPLGNRVLIDSLMHDGLSCARSGKGMGQVADELARRDLISRREQDEFALESHRRAILAMHEGIFNDEVVPVSVPGRKGQSSVVSSDEGPQVDTSLDRLGALSPAFDLEGSVTAGNASMISDGAAALFVASSEAASRLGKRPIARIVASATSGVEPEDLFIAPVSAIRKVLMLAGLQLSEIDRFELNEAFAVQVLACSRRLELDHDRVNVRGGAIALGHPIGASGSRVLVTLLHELRRSGGRYGLASLCLGGGNAVALIVERLDS